MATLGVGKKSLSGIDHNILFVRVGGRRNDLGCNASNLIGR